MPRRFELTAGGSVTLIRLERAVDDDNDDSVDSGNYSITGCVRFIAENVRTSASTAAKRSRRPAFYERTFDNTPVKNLSR